MKEEQNLAILLSRNEALVLFEFLASLDSRPGAVPADASEETVIWKIEGQLESLLTEPLMPNYRELLDDARRAVRGDK